MNGSENNLYKSIKKQVMNILKDSAISKSKIPIKEANIIISRKIRLNKNDIRFILKDLDSDGEIIYKAKFYVETDVK